MLSLGMHVLKHAATKVTRMLIYVSLSGFNSDRSLKTPFEQMTILFMDGEGIQEFQGLRLNVHKSKILFPLVCWATICSSIQALLGYTESCSYIRVHTSEPETQSTSG